MNGGSGYVESETLNVVDIFLLKLLVIVLASVTVDKVYNNLDDTIQVTGISSDGYSQYNQLYRNY